MAFVFGRGFVLTCNISILTPEFIIPVAIYHPGFLITRLTFTCPVLLYIRSLSAAMLFGYEVRVLPGHCRLLLLLLVRCWLYSDLPGTTYHALSMRYLVPGTQYIPYLASD